MLLNAVAPDTQGLNSETSIDAGIYQATGFSSSTFGAVTAKYSIIELAAGFSPSVFGTPSFVGANIANGFASAAFGLPVCLASISGQVTGFSLTAFGAPTYGTHSVAGFSTSAFGAVGHRSSIAGAVGGIALPTFGIPALKASVSCEALGFTPSEFGLPVGGLLNQCAAGEWLNPSVFSVPNCAFQQHGLATGFCSTYFYQPRHDPHGWMDAVSFLTKTQVVKVVSKSKQVTIRA